MLTRTVPIAELTGNAATMFGISFAVLMGILGGSVVVLRMRQSQARYRDTRTGTALLVTAISFAFVLFIFLLEPGVPWWVLLISASGFAWGGLAELRKLRARSRPGGQGTGGQGPRA